MKNGRDRRGQFAAGNPGGPGRPRRATEAEYLQALSQVVSVEDLRAIARRAVADAKRGNARARDWLSKYLLGDPVPKARPGTGGGGWASDAALQALLDELAKEPAAAGPAGEGRPAEGPAAGGPGAQAAPQGPATPPPGEENR
jgi:hypothetical protein